MTGNAVEALVEANGTRLNVRLEGSSLAPCVVLIHSLGTDLTIWDEQARALARIYRVLRLDIRGHGRSDAPKGPYSMELLAADACALLAHFGIRGAHIVGISLGGLIGLALAEAKAGEIASLCVCDTNAEVSADFAKGIEDRNLLVREKGMAAIAQAMVERWLTLETIAAKPMLADHIRDLVRTTPVEGFVGCAQAIRSSRLDRALGTIALPTLFVAGDRDMANEPVRRMHAALPGSTFVEIGGASHLANLDQPEAFNRAILEFLERIVKSG
ncbi:MAG: alpha/beta fold hydrolase [Hyphomicrobiales bacterium]